MKTTLKISWKEVVLKSKIWLKAYDTLLSLEEYDDIKSRWVLLNVIFVASAVSFTLYARTLRVFPCDLWDFFWKR